MIMTMRVPGKDESVARRVFKRIANYQQLPSSSHSVQGWLFAALKISQLLFPHQPLCFLLFSTIFKQFLLVPIRSKLYCNSMLYQCTKNVTKFCRCIVYPKVFTHVNYSALSLTRMLCVGTIKHSLEEVGIKIPINCFFVVLANYFNA